MERKKLVAGNWKMNGGLSSNEQLIKGFLQEVDASTDVSVFCPFPYLGQLQALLLGRGVQFGAQDVSVHRSGAYTGDVSVAMLKEFGVTQALVGHSERRIYQGESSELVARKAELLLSEGVTPVVCVGETLEEREAGQVEVVIASQLDPVLTLCAQFILAGEVEFIVAYEPVWAIGTGVTASPQQAQEVHALIRARLRSILGLGVAEKIRILYGGSVKPSNAVEIFQQEDIDGGLIGGASLSAIEFSGIIQAARKKV